MSEEDLLEYLPDAKFKLDDVKKFVGEAPGSRVMPYEVTFRGFSSELSMALEELYKSPVFFVVKNIAVIEATGVVDDFEEEEEDEMSLVVVVAAVCARHMGRWVWEGAVCPAMEPCHTGCRV